MCCCFWTARAPICESTPVVAPRPGARFCCDATPSSDSSPLSLHDALPILTATTCSPLAALARATSSRSGISARQGGHQVRSEEHTSELQSPCKLVCRLLLEKKKKRRCEHGVSKS